jgi:hypothetical protein
VIPAQDYGYLYDAGVKGIYGPGTPIPAARRTCWSRGGCGRSGNILYEGGLVGFVAVHPAKGTTCWLLDHLYMQPTAQGQGIGSLGDGPACWTRPTDAGWQ